MGAQTFHALKDILSKEGYSTNVGDEGGFAPDLRAMMRHVRLLSRRLKQQDFKPGKDIAIALDPATSSFFKNGVYNLAKSDRGKRPVMKWWHSTQHGLESIQLFL